MLSPEPFSTSLTFTSKEGLKSLSLDRNFDGVSRCNEGSFWSDCPVVGETEACLECCDITVRKALLWKLFISKGVTAVFLRVSRCVTGCSGVSGFRFTSFVVSVSKLCSRDLKWKETNVSHWCRFLVSKEASDVFYLTISFPVNS